MASFRMGDSDGEYNPDAPIDDSLSAALAARFGIKDDPEPVDAVVPDESQNVGETGDSSPLSLVSPATPDVDEVAPVEVEDTPPVELEDGESGGFVIADDDEPATDASSNPTPPTEDELDLNDLFTRWNGGTRPDASQMANLLSFVQQVQALPPERQAALNAALYGTEPTPANTPDATATKPAESSYTLPENLDDGAREILEPLVARLAQLESAYTQQQVSTQQAQYQAQQEQITKGVTRATEEFVGSYKEILTKADLTLLEIKAQNSGQFPYFLQQNGNDPQAAYKALLEATVYADPSLRERVVAHTTQKLAAQNATDEARKRRAAAVSGGGTANPAKRAPVKPTAAPSIFDAKQAAIEELRTITGNKF